MEDVVLSSELVINYIESLLNTYNNKTIILEFFISHNYLFLETDYKEGANKIITTKTKLNLDIDSIDVFYQELYKLFKRVYIKSKDRKVQMVKEFDFSNYNNPYLSFKIHDVHLNEIDLRLRDLGNLKDNLKEIENDILNLYEEKSKTK